jgi:hypothetical protein
MLEMQKNAEAMVTWIPKTAIDFVRNPLKKFEEDPLGVIMLFGIAAGFAGKGLFKVSIDQFSKRAKAAGWPEEVVKPIMEAADRFIKPGGLVKEVKRFIEIQNKEIPMPSARGIEPPPTAGLPTPGVPIEPVPTPETPIVEPTSLKKAEMPISEVSKVEAPGEMAMRLRKKMKVTPSAWKERPIHWAEEEEALGYRRGLAAVGEKPVHVGIRGAVPPERPPKLITKIPDELLAQEDRVLGVESRILNKTGHPEEAIKNYIENKFWDGEKLREVTKNVMAGKITEEEAVADIKGDLDSMIAKPEFALTREEGLVATRKPAVPKVEEPTLIPKEEVVARYPAGYDTRGMRTFPNVNVAREAIEPERQKGWNIEFGQAPDLTAWARLTGKGPTGKGELKYVKLAKKGEFLEKPGVQPTFPEEKPTLPITPPEELGFATRPGTIRPQTPEQLAGKQVIAEAKSLEGKVSLPYDEWIKSEEGGFIDLPMNKTFGQSKKSRVYQDIIDRFHPIKKLTDIIKKEGVELPIGNDPYINIRNYLGVQGKAETKLMYKRFSVDKNGNVQFKGKSFADIIEPIKAKIDDFDRYLVTRRVPELEKRGIKTGIDLKEAGAFNLEHGKDFEPAAREYTDFMFSLLDELVDSGRLKKTTADIIKSKNPSYAPFQRIVDDLKEYGYIPTSDKVLSKIGMPIRRIKGSEKVIISPLESTIKATYVITSAAERNRIANMILDLRKFSPRIAEIIKPIRPKMALVATLEDGTKVYRPSHFQKQGILEVWKDGKRHFFEVPQDLYDSMSQLDKTSFNWLTKLLALPARILRTGATTTPEFAFRNPVRDQWSAFVNAKYGYFPGFDFARGLFMMAKKPELYWKWKASGGEWSMLVTLDRASNQKMLKQVLGHADYKKYLTNPIGLLEDFSMVGEMPTRLGVFRHAHEKGAPDIEAGFESREATVDFARRGAKMKVLSALYTFFNARLQGMEKMARSFRARPTKTLLKVAAVAVIPSIINYLVNRDDDKYWEIPSWQRALFWIIPIKGHYIRIPKGDTGVLFGTTTEMILNYIDKEKGGKYTLNQFANALINETLPVSDIGGFLPVAFRTPFELFANKSFFTNRPIVTEGQENLEKRYQYSPFTSETGKLIGQALNVSPAKVDHLMIGYGAGLARYSLALSDAVLNEMGIVPKKPERPKELADYPVVRAFVVRDPLGFGSESVSQFYDAADKILQFKSTAKMLLKKQNYEEIKNLAKRNDFYLELVQRGVDKDFTKQQSDLSSLRQLRDMILDSEKLTVDQKRQAVDEIEALVMAKVTSVLSKYKAIEQMIKEKKGNVENKTNPGVESNYRPDGTLKGPGYFGRLQRPDGDVSTELSIGVTGPEYGNKETQVPLLVPTLTRQEIDYLLAGNEPTEQIIAKAERHAQMRIARGLSPFARTGEQQSLPKKEKK